MRLVIISALALALAAPALAQEASDTIKAVTTKGIVLDVGGMKIDVTYTPDGKFTAMDGQVTGTWKAKGDKLCTTSNMQPEESCTAYPLGKKSGDSFDLTSDQGTATITIK